MKIVEVKTYSLVYPVREPFANAMRWTRERPFGVVEVLTDNGITGWGEGATVPGHRAIETHVIGRSPFENEVIWEGLHRQGTDTTAISAIDIALWDLRGKAAKMPVMDLLGVYSRKLRCYATGGYYRAGQTQNELADEYRLYVEHGFDAVKLKVGKLGASEDARRMKAVRHAVGDEVDILLDANGGWPDAPTAIAAMRRLEEFRPFWIEEPVRADNLAAMARIADALDTPVATGELEATRWAFHQITELKAADILQPDATVCGGVSEWLKIAHMAAAMDLPVAPHYNWDIHSQLSATIPNHCITEYFVRESGVKLFDELLANPIYPDKGMLTPRTGPGFGIEYIPEQIERYRIG